MRRKEESRGKDIQGAEIGIKWAKVKVRQKGRDEEKEEGENDEEAVMVEGKGKKVEVKQREGRKGSEGKGGI